MSLRSRFRRLRSRAGSWLAGRALQAHYAGASMSRLFYDWAAGIVSADTEIRGNLTILRARARQLVRDNAYMEGFALAVEDNLIGPDGILLQAKVANAQGKLSKATNFAIEEAWKDWSNPENASIDGMQSWVDLQRLAARGIKIDGEAIFRIHTGVDNDYRFALQPIDPDLLDDTFDRPATGGRNEIRMGVEVDLDGRPLFYHLWPAHPTEMLRRPQGSRDRIPVPAAEIIHLFRRKRPGQTRGVTELAPILTDMKMLAGYTEAELVAARFHAAKMVAITIPDPEKAIVQTAKAGQANTATRLDVAPGGVWRLNPGEMIETFDPTHPNVAFRDFVSTILRGIARALGVSYLTFTGDVSAANYSSMRAGLLPEREHWRMQQRWMATHFHRRVYRAWLPQALVTGQLVTDRRIATEMRNVEWKPRGWKWVDPQNDLTALEMEIMLGINSRQSACAERGVDYEDKVDELQYEQEYAAEAEVWVQGAGGPERFITEDPNASPAAPADEGDESAPRDANPKKRAVALEVV